MLQLVAMLSMLAFSIPSSGALGATDPPLVIAHRGASGERPEHTLEAYRLAIQQGADYIEPDLVITRDGVLVARHENEISGTTDVAYRREFANRRTTREIDGEEVTGWFTEDFSLEELRSLYARERLPELRPNNTAFDGRLRIPTLDEIIDLAEEMSRATSRRIGIYPETKHPSYFRSIGLPLEEPLVETLERRGLNVTDAPVFIQSFEVENLKRLAGMTPVRLIQLASPDGRPYDFTASGDERTYRQMMTADGLAEIASYAHGIGVHKDLVIPRDDRLNLLEPSSLVDDAHAAGLLVHVWTFRSENYFLPANLRTGDAASPEFLAEHGRALEEYRLYFEAGIDGVFSDFPAAAVSARRAYSE
jgi:glycerophosphoryl diester phosphodiesterase